MNEMSHDRFEHEPERNQFVLHLEKGKAYVSYTKTDDTLFLVHSQVPFELRGKGIGKQLVDRTFEYIQEHQIKAVAVCTYIKLIRDRSSKWRNIIG